MRKLPFVLPIVVAACAGGDLKPPILPGYVNAPPPPIAAAGDSLLTGTVWAWQDTQMSDGKRIAPDVPERYTLLFDPGGKLDVRADCNRGSATYMLNGGALTLGPVALTRMACAPGSRDAEFLDELKVVTGQLFRGTDLVLLLNYDSGSMRLTTPRR